MLTENLDQKIYQVKKDAESLARQVRKKTQIFILNDLKMYGFAAILFVK
jgi:hypothetical protein